MCGGALPLTRPVEERSVGPAARGATPTSGRWGGWITSRGGIVKAGDDEASEGERRSRLNLSDFLCSKPRRKPSNMCRRSC